MILVETIYQLGGIHRRRILGGISVHSGEHWVHLARTPVNQADEEFLTGIMRQGTWNKGGGYSFRTVAVVKTNMELTLEETFLNSELNSVLYLQAMNLLWNQL